MYCTYPTRTTPHLLQLKREYVSLVDNYGCVVQETFTVQDPPVSPSETILLPSLKCLYKANERTQERPQTLQSLISTEYFNSWLFINDRQSKLPGFKTLTLVLALTIPMSLY